MTVTLDEKISLLAVKANQLAQFMASAFQPTDEAMDMLAAHLKRLEEVRASVAAELATLEKAAA